MSNGFEHPAPAPAQGGYAEGFAPVARTFARQLAQEVGASVTVYQRGRCVVDLWGGLADVRARTPWQRDTRIVVFSVTKGFAAMALHLLRDRGKLDWDAPVASYWPELARAGKESITVGTLLSHRAGLPYLDRKVTLEDCARGASVVERALVEQRPAWEPGTAQGYHALTFGMYAAALFERVAGEPMGPFLRRELFEPLGADVDLGTPESVDDRIATLYPPSVPSRIVNAISSAVRAPRSTEARVARAALAPGSVNRRAFLNPGPGKRGVHAYNEPPVRRAGLAWASATASAHGVARSYLPFAQQGEHGGRRYLRDESLRDAYGRRSWSERDLVIHKPMGWSNGFLKEEPHLFSPTPESFGHAGMGGALGWCDPVHQLTLGYVMNRMDWRVRSPRALALCQALYECEPVRGAR